MATTAELLASVDTAIAARLSGDAYEEYTEGGDRFKGASLEDLFRIRKQLTGQVAAESGSGFALAELFDE